MSTAVYTLDPRHIVYSLSPSHPPALSVPDGAVVHIETCDCFENQIEREDQDFGTLDWSRINPATGPVHVEGAAPGDLLAVHILDIELANRGIMTTGPDLGVMGAHLSENAIRFVEIDQNQVVLPGGVRAPLRPMIGVIGVAPATGAIPCGTPGDHGGNMDCTRITAGVVLLLPVSAPGALFALGDLHAAMGDGEVGVSGVEIAGRVTVRLEVVRGATCPAPMVVSADDVSIIASAATLDEAAELATKRAATWLAAAAHLHLADACMLLSAAGRLRICQVVDPLKTARMEIDRDLLHQLRVHLPV
ncbi:acetamidase/formamidase family protein [Alicyclobacillus acidocaldarius]|uniref:Acetamidase/Formamidase n=1 Tax=Alicyclobacillus acidocaldarius subsp. acidocaldarius (strain ATCC 27009 / DSM 446 / BCRC 14685 / JCM 5260 / KCTC 1825 / NBRC 15652 / NCIMB 11725 / NRRL B-14509 / 104-IA) TaxID=521098 RepID=C8WU54_ALIAD|nr:acetamidase/formamidase family protein [Alicyclobacillus acidocaldarius]ACV57817.1 Acetamidase/Formamidase [Alicyclobacillus acidocaldarius subsp. acidocaldarius DSM 446]